MNQAGGWAAPGAAAPVKAPRDLRIDFLRGLALIFIFVDHVPDSLFSLFTVRSLCLCRCSRTVLLPLGLCRRHGLWAASPEPRACSPRPARSGAARACSMSRRSCSSSSWSRRSRWPLPAPATASTIGQLPARPTPPSARPAALPHALLLRYQPAYLDILPVYVLLHDRLPARRFCGLARNLWLVLLPSAALYVARADLGGHPAHLPRWRRLVLQSAGLAVPVRARRQPSVIRNGSRAGAVSTIPGCCEPRIAVAAIAARDAVSRSAAHASGRICPCCMPAALPVDKAALEPLRIVSFLALALIVRRYLPAGAELARTAAGAPDDPLWAVLAADFLRRNCAGRGRTGPGRGNRPFAC